MNKFMKIMLSLVLVFSIATINLDASSKVTKYNNGNVKTRTYYNGNKKTKQVEYTSTGRKSMMYTFNSNGKVYTKYYYDANGKQNRSYRYDKYGRKSSAYDYKTVKGKRVIIKKWNYTTSGKKSKYQQYYDNGKLKTSISYYSNGKTKQVIKYNSKGKVTSNKKYSSGSSSSNNTKYPTGSVGAGVDACKKIINDDYRAKGWIIDKNGNDWRTSIWGDNVSGYTSCHIRNIANGNSIGGRAYVVDNKNGTYDIGWITTDTYPF